MDSPKSLCKHFGICGGCQFQDVPYDEQLLAKRQIIKDLAYSINISNTVIKPVNHFRKWFYRGKMEFTFSETEGQVVLGLHSKRDKRKVFDAGECRIFSEDTTPILNSVRAFCKKHNYRAYNTFSRNGFLRHLIVRETKFTGQTMIGIVTTSLETLDEDNFVRAVLSLSIKNKISSIYWIVNDSSGDAVVFQKKKLLYGDAFITEKLHSYYFRIYIDSFFQTNSEGIASLYNNIREYLPSLNKMKILDLFCGAGGMGIFLSSKAKFVWGVEVTESSVRNAFDNAALNNIKNISFVCADVRKFLLQKELKGNIDCVVVNPPRSGLSVKIRKRLADIDSPRIFYSSCNPQTLFSDIEDLNSYYKPVFIEPFDFFPHTKHMETLVLLEKINS